MIWGEKLQLSLHFSRAESALDTQQMFQSFFVLGLRRAVRTDTQLHPEMGIN